MGRSARMAACRDRDGIRRAPGTARGAGAGAVASASSGASDSRRALRHRLHDVQSTRPRRPAASWLTRSGSRTNGRASVRKSASPDRRIPPRSPSGGGCTTATWTCRGSWLTSISPRMTMWLPMRSATAHGRSSPPTGVPFNSVGLSLYRDGRDSVAPHTTTWTRSSREPHGRWPTRAGPRRRSIPVRAPARSAGPERSTTPIRLSKDSARLQHGREPARDRAP